MPIYTRSLDLYAYELRFCSEEAIHKGVQDDEKTLEKLLVQAAQSVRLDQITGTNLGFVKIPGQLLASHSQLPWPKDRIVLNITERIIDGEIEKSLLGELAKRGYLFSLESESFSSELAHNLEFAAIWSLSANVVDAGLKEQIAFIHKKGLRLLARHVETAEQFERCRRLGFDYFQGDFFERPRIIKGTEIPANKLAVIHLLARVQDPNVNIKEVEEIIRQDMTMSYKLLRLINSAFFGIPKRVDSLRRAVVFFGLQRIKNWAAVVLVNAIDYEPRELLVTAMVRARTCELLAQARKCDNAEAFYIAGLFSLLDAIMNVPMAEILKRLNLIDEINEALLYGRGPIGDVLSTTVAFEHGQCHKVSCRQLDAETVMQSYLDAIAWANEVRRQLIAP